MNLALIRLVMLSLLLTGGASASAQTPAPSAPAAATNLPASLKPEDAFWLSAQENLRFRQFQEARLKFEQFSLKYRSDPRAAEAMFYQGLCQFKLGQEFQALTLWNRLVQQEELKHARSAALRLALEQLALFHERKGGTEYTQALGKMRQTFPDEEVTATLHRHAAEKKMATRDYAGAIMLYQVFAQRLTAVDQRNLELARKLVGEPGRDPAAILKLANASLAWNELELATSLYETLLTQCPPALAGDAKTAVCRTWGEGLFPGGATAGGRALAGGQAGMDGSRRLRRSG